MSRKEVKQREISPDPKFRSVAIAKFMNRLMLCGKKSVAERIIYAALDVLSDKTKEPHVEAFEKALGNVKPTLEVRSRRVGGATYQIPVEVQFHRGQMLAMHWILQAARKRSGKAMEVSLAEELLDAYNARGAAIKKKEDTHKMAASNRAFSHYRW